MQNCVRRESPANVHFVRFQGTRRWLHQLQRDFLNFPDLSSLSTRSWIIVFISVLLSALLYKVWKILAKVVAISSSPELPSTDIRLACCLHLLHPKIMDKLLHCTAPDLFMSFLKENTQRRKYLSILVAKLPTKFSFSN